MYERAVYRLHTPKISAIGQPAALRLGTEALQIMRSVSDACGSFLEQQPQQQRAITPAVMQKAT